MSTEDQIQYEEIRRAIVSSAVSDYSDCVLHGIRPNVKDRLRSEGYRISTYPTTDIKSVSTEIISW